jgi:hypothetical protein
LLEFNHVVEKGTEVQMSADLINPRRITLILSDLHVRRMIEKHSLKEAEAEDMNRLSAIAQQLFDEALGLPEEVWHEWDDWAKGLA